MSIRITGTDELLQALRMGTKVALDALEAAVEVEIEKVATKSKSVTPRMDGLLRASQVIDVRRRHNGITGQIGYGGASIPYAL